MKIIANIWFEKLHREIYDNIYTQNPKRGLDVEKLKKKEELYNKLLPYFEGWRFSLKINLWFIRKYRRYEPKKLDLMKYEFSNLGMWNKCIYAIKFNFAKLLK